MVVGVGVKNLEGGELWVETDFFLQFFFYNNEQTQSQGRAPEMSEMPIVFANIVLHSVYLSIFETH